MSKFITKFSNELSDQVAQMQKRLKLLKEKVSVETTEKRDDMREYIEKLDAQIERNRKRLKEASEEVENWAEERVETLNEWRSKRHVDKLVDRADRADRYAKARMDIAINALDKAERAMLQASLAQAEAESAKESETI